MLAILGLSPVTTQRVDDDNGINGRKIWPSAVDVPFQQVLFHASGVGHVLDDGVRISTEAFPLR